MPAPAAAGPTAASVWDRWVAGFAHVASFRTARAAMAALLRARSIERLWLPSYLCRTAVPAVGEVRWYPVAATLEPDAAALAAGLRPGDGVMVVDYFGRSPGPSLIEVARGRRDVLWIEDRAQALAPDRPPFGDVVLYSPRKLFGVADGGLLLAHSPLPAPEAAPDPPKLWAANDARAADPDGRAPETWFPAFRAREAAFTAAPEPMSRRTLEVLHAIEMKPEAAARRANWAALAGPLHAYALFTDREPGFAPLAFPILVDDAGEVAARLAAQLIWCARHWSDLPSCAERFPEAHDLAARCLSLPLDPRYGPADMARLAQAVQAAAPPSSPRL